MLPNPAAPGETPGIVCRLPSGYVIRRVDGVHLVNGTPADSFRSDVTREIVITDPGPCDPDELVRRTARAVFKCVLNGVRSSRASSSSEGGNANA